jgi:hypothetical protein
MLVFEDAGIALIPNFTRCKEGDGGQILVFSHGAPPREDSVHRPCLVVNEVEPETILNEPPKPDGKSTMKEKVVHRLGTQLAKRTPRDIISHSILKVDLPN